MDAAGDAWMSKERLRNAKARTNADAHERKEVKPWEEPLRRSRGKIPWEEAAGKAPRRHLLAPLVPKDFHFLAPLVPKELHFLATLVPKDFHFLGPVVLKDFHFLALLALKDVRFLAPLVPKDFHFPAPLVPKDFHVLASIGS